MKMKPQPHDDELEDDSLKAERAETGDSAYEPDLLNLALPPLPPGITLPQIEDCYPLVTPNVPTEPADVLPRPSDEDIEAFLMRPTPPRADGGF